MDLVCVSFVVEVDNGIYNFIGCLGICYLVCYLVFGEFS